jgi:hypothetical protein
MGGWGFSPVQSQRHFGRIESASDDRSFVTEPEAVSQRVLDELPEAVPDVLGSLCASPLVFCISRVE